MCTLAVLWVVPAVAQPLTEFQQARTAFQEGRYDEAARGFRLLVESIDPRGENASLHYEARKYLGITYLFLQREADARLQVREYLRYVLPRIEGFRLDPVLWPEPVVDFFDETKEALERERRAAEAADAALAEAEARERESATAAYVAALEAQAAERVVRQTHSRWIALIPFGVGQFQNGHDGLGWTLLVGQVLTAGVSIVSGVLWANLDPADTVDGERVIPESFNEVERTYVITNWVSTGLFIALAIVGIVDAQVRFVPEVNAVEPRPLPPDPRRARRDGPDLRLGPGGLTLRF